MPFLLDSTIGELADAAATSRGSSPIRSSRVERDAAGALVAPRRRGDRRRRGRARARASSRSIRRASTSEARASGLADGLERGARPTSPSRCADWRADARRASTEAIARPIAPTRRRCPADEIAEAIAFLDGCSHGQLHLPRHARVPLLGGDDAGTLDRVEAQRPRPPARPGRARAPPRRRARARRRRESRDFLDEPEPLIITKANVKSRVHRRAYHRLCRRQAVLRRGRPARRRVAHRRPVHLDRLHALDRGDSVSAPQGRRGARPRRASTRRAIPARRSSTCSRPIRATSCSRSTRTRSSDFAARHPAARRAAARARPGAARRVRPLRLGPRLRAARPLRQRRSARRSAPISPTPIDGPRLGLLPGLSGRRRWRASISSSAAPAAADADVDRARARRRHRATSCAPGTTRSRRARRDDEPARARALLARYGDAFPPAYRDAFSPRDALADIAHHRAPDAGARRSPSISTARDGDETARVGLKVCTRGRRAALGARADAREHGLPGRSTSAPIDVAAGGAASADVSGCTTWRSSAPTAARSTSERSQARSRHAFLAVLRGRRRKRRLQRARARRRARLARRRAAARLRALPAAGPRSLFARTTSPDDAAPATARSPAQIVDAVLRALRSARSDADASAPSAEAALAAEIEDGARPRSTSLDDDRILRRFVNLVEAAVRTNFFQIDADGRPRPTIAFKFDCRKVDGLPLPRPLCEIFVYSPRVEGVHLRFGKVARGGIRWSDRPQDFRTEVLGPRQGAAGQERRDRAGRRQGRLRAEAAAAGRRDRDAWLAEGTGSLPHLHVARCSTSPTTSSPTGSCRRPTPCATTATTPTWSSPPTRARRPSPTSPTRSRSSTASGSATPSRRGGSPATTTRSMGITARGAWEAVKRHFREMDVDIQTTPFTRRRASATCPGDVFGNGMLLSSARSGSSPPSTTATSSSIPTPIRRRRFAERKRLFDLPRSSWQDYDKALISTGGGVFSRSRSRSALSREAQARCSASTRPRRRPPR